MLCHPFSIRVVMTIEKKLKIVVETAVNKAIAKGKLEVASDSPISVEIERPRLPEHGDLSCGVALKLASLLRASPLKIAETIAGELEVFQNQISQFEVSAPGFINFRLGNSWLAESLQEILKLDCDYGRSDLGTGQRVLIEYVSANPTGDLHIGHGRGAVYGSCLANLLAFSGYKVEQEFYVNDTGEQIAQLGRCAWACYKRRLGVETQYPEEGYPEASIEKFVDQIIRLNGGKFLPLTDVEAQNQLAEILKEVIMNAQKELLSTLRINFDRWYSELSLHERGAVQNVLNCFAETDMSYESEGALWLKAKELGDERDRVLRKNDGKTTYLAADAAYHLDKYERGYDHLITIWGADHHGQVPGLKAAIQALGRDPKKLEVILTQIVNLRRDGQTVRMSKRMGTVVALSDVMDEVGIDAVRYYLAESNPQNQINFDLELAKKASKDNPAFYIQYAHARCCAILRKVLEGTGGAENRIGEKRILTSADWSSYLEDYKLQSQVFEPLFTDSPEALACQKALIMRLQEFPKEVEEAARARTPDKLARYAYEVANHLQRYYEVARVITDDSAVTKARLGLILAVRQVLANVLGILGVQAPERM